MIKKILIIIFLIIFVLSLTACRYNEDYKTDLGIPKYILGYNEIINFFGKPKNEIDIADKYNYYKDLVYQDMIIHLYTLFETDNKDEYRTMAYEILTDKYEFGRKKIKVGSTRKEVKSAYWGVKSVPEYEEGGGYHDGDIYILFIYDKNDVVTKIKILPKRNT